MLKKIWEKILEYDVIVISRHVRPDGDASGSQLGLKYLIQANTKGKKIYCEGEANTYAGKLVGNVDTEIKIEPNTKYLNVILDTPSYARIDGELYKNASEIIKVDHHIFVDEFGGIEYIDTSSVAASLLVARLAFELKLKVNSKVATALYFGIVTDSNRFLYEGVNEETFKIARFLLSRGAKIFEIYDYIYEVDVVSLKFKGFCMNNFVVTNEGLAYNKFSKEVLEEYGVSGNFAASCVNSIANIKGVHVHVHFAYVEEGVIRVELRSKKVPINFIATKYGGGGHKLASGAQLKTWKEVDNMIMDINDLLREAFNNEEL